MNAWTLLPLLLLSAGTALADCGAVLQVPATRAISPWLAVELAHGGLLQESVDVRISGAAGCPPLALGAEIELPPGVRMRASLRGAPNGAEIGSTPGSGQPLLALAIDPSGASVIDPVIEWSAEGAPLPAGRHALQIRWRLYAANALLPQALTELQTRVQADVPAVLDVALIANGARQPLGGASATLDFGEISSGDLREVDIEIRGNARAQLAVSRRWGQLRLRNRPDYTIPYTLLLDGQPLSSVAAPQTLDIRGELSRARLGVRIGELERRAAGVYEDTLTVVVAPE